MITLCRSMSSTDEEKHGIFSMAVSKGEDLDKLIDSNLKTYIQILSCCNNFYSEIAYL